MLSTINKISINLKKNLGIFYVGIILYFVGVCLGLIFKNVTILTYYEDIALNFYQNSISPNANSITYLFLRILNVVLLFIVVFLLSFNNVSVLLNFFIILYKGFVLSLSLRCLFLSLSLNGVFVFLFLILFQNVIVAISVLFVIINIYKINDCIKKYRLNYILKCVLLSMAFACVGCVVEFILLISIVRPFNMFF